MKDIDEMIEKLKIYGADIDGSMDRMLNDKAFYLECICMFLQDENFDILKNSLDNDDLSTAFEAAHALKGVSANLGLIPIYDAACNIVEPLREKKNLNYIEMYQKIIGLRQKLREKVEE